MPLYEYKCGACGAVFEALQKFSDEPLKLHEACGGRLERLISSSSFQLKGSGWYVTDYARGGRGNGKSKDTKDSSAGSKTDAKVAAKTESKTSDSAKSTD